MDQVGGGLVLWCGGGDDAEHRGGALAVGLEGGDGLDAGVGGDGDLERGEVVDGGAVEPRRQQERAVEPGPETVAQQVVGLPGRHRGRAGAVVGHAQAQAEHGGRQQPDGQRAADQVAPRVGRHLPAPAVPERLAAGDAGAGPRPGHADGVDLVAGEAQQRRQQRQGEGHHHGHGQAGHQAHDRHRRDAGDGQAGDGDDDGGAGEQDRGPRRGDGPAGRLLDRHAQPQVLAVAGDDEQGVVDADAQADHGGEDRGDRVHVDNGGHERDQPEAGGQADQGQADGQAHGDDRPERDQQHHDGDQDADGLLATRRLLRRLAGQVAAELHAHRAGVVGVGHGGLEPVVGRVSDVHGGLVVLHVDVRDAVVGRALHLAHRAHIGLAGHVGQGGVDRRRGPGVGQRAVLGGEHELGGGAGRRGEVLLEHVERLLRLDARDVEGVGGLAAADLRGGDDADGEDGPGEDGEAAPPHTRATQPVEEGGHARTLLAVMP